MNVSKWQGSILYGIDSRVNTTRAISPFTYHASKYGSTFWEYANQCETRKIAMHEFVLNAFEEIRNVQMMISVFIK